MQNPPPQKNWKNSSTAKFLFIGFLVLVMLIPAVLVKDLVSERKYRSIHVQEEISDKWGKSQKVSGPVLTVPYRIDHRDNNGNVVSYSFKKIHLLPNTLNIDGKINPQIKKRGIFETVVYNGNLNISGSFQTGKDNLPFGDILWHDSKISIGIPDLKGLKEVPKIKWNKMEITLKAGQGEENLFSKNIGNNISLEYNQTYNFKIDLNLNGSKEISFIPMGETTTANIESPWENPSFQGGFLPESSQISKEGFTANWKILSLNRSFPQLWDNYIHNTYNSEFGIKFITPVDIYHQTERSVKYAILFILLSFLSYFIVEIIKKVKIHPIQYLLVGSAIILFYLILLSLSEHIPFLAAYLVGAISIISIISLYTGAILKKKKMAYVLASILSGLYVYLYILLQLEDYALLIGTIGLFMVLSGIMYLTRKIDWYENNQ